MNPEDQQKIERFVRTAMRGLPQRNAPDTLMARVQAEIERRAALPWWHKSFVYWPLAVRAVFVVASVFVVKVVFTVVGWLATGATATQFRTAFASELQWYRAARVLGDTLTQLVDTTISGISPYWLYGGAAVIAALYVTLFGLGTVAYRTLYANR